MRNAAISIWAVDDDPIKLPVTPDWRKRMFDAFELLPHGAKQECAAYAKCSPALISKILSGETDSSEHLVLISEYLKIPPPMVVVESLRQVALMRVAVGLSAEDLDLLIANANRMKR